MLGARYDLNPRYPRYPRPWPTSRPWQASPFHTPPRVRHASLSHRCPRVNSRPFLATTVSITTKRATSLRCGRWRKHSKMTLPTTARTPPLLVALMSRPRLVGCAMPLTLLVGYATRTHSTPRCRHGYAAQTHSMHPCRHSTHPYRHAQVSLLPLSPKMAPNILI